MGYQLVAEPRHVLRLAVKAVDGLHCLGGVFVDDAGGKLIEILFIRQARRLSDDPVVDIAADGDAAVKQRERVAKRAVGNARDKHGGAVAKRGVFVLRYIFYPVRDSLRRYPVKIEPLTARQNRLRQLMHLGGGEDEYHVLRRLLKRFKQRVERLGGEHMHLVDDIHAIARAVGLELHLVDDVADIFDLAVARRVHLHHIEDAAVLNASAYLALAAGVAVFGVKAVCRLCQNLGAGGLARTARPGKEVGVVEPVFLYFIFQRGRDVLLTRNIVKGLRPPLAV